MVEERHLHGVLLDLVGFQAELELARLFVLLCKENPSKHMILLNELVHQFQVGLVAVPVHHANYVQEPQILRVKLALSIQGAYTHLISHTHPISLLAN